MNFPQKREGTDHQCIVYLKKKEIFMIRSPVKSPRSFKNNLPVLLGTLQMQVQRPVCVVSNDNANSFKDYHTKVEFYSLSNNQPWDMEIYPALR